MNKTESVRFRKDALMYVQELFSKESCFDSPINLNVGDMKQIKMPCLYWFHNNLPCKKMKLLNSGHTIILSAKWYEERPYINGGPLDGNYVFSQLHFHWGATDLEGSEHTADGTQHPIEMHVVYFKSCYLTQEAALKQKDGVVVVAYFFKLQSHTNPDVQILLDAAKQIKKPNTSVRMGKLALDFLIKPFAQDYFMYWGSVSTTTTCHIIMYLICRVPLGISAKQVGIFRKLYNTFDEPNLRNYREVLYSKKNVYHINPSTMKYATLLPIAAESYQIQKKN